MQRWSAKRIRTTWRRRPARWRAQAVGDALAIALMRARRLTAEQFGRYHPGGQLGRNLRTSVRQAMHGAGEAVMVPPETSFKELIIAMTRLPLGGACVVTAEGRLAGFITDGDLRRALAHHDDIRGLRAADIMTANPVTHRSGRQPGVALERMERRASQISALPGGR